MIFSYFCAVDRVSCSEGGLCEVPGHALGPGGPPGAAGCQPELPANAGGGRRFQSL